MSESLSNAKGFIAYETFGRTAEKPFVPENVVLGEYTFVSWARSGLSAAIQSADSGSVRGIVSVSFDVTEDGGATIPVKKVLTLRGPSDVMNIDTAQIVRRVPAPNTPNAESSFLAHIEFDRPEFPWLFSPFAAVGEKIMPWVVLVVCDARVSEVEPGGAGLPQVLVTKLGELPPLEDAWAWAHAQVAGSIGESISVADRLSNQHGPQNLSRILCPRRLDPDHARDWIAALVPTFDAGVKAATGANGGTLDFAWRRAPNGSDANQDIRLPAFDVWRFSTAPKGDFESLAKRLVGVPAPWNIGRRIIDVSFPRGRLQALDTSETGARQVLRCALVSPRPMPLDQPAEGVDWTPTRRDALRAELDRVSNADEDLPKIGARLYARYQRGAGQLGPVLGTPPTSSATADSDWFSQLNTSPMLRIIAGLGTRVVQRDQERLMQAAWAQVGEIEKANQALARMQFGRYVGEALHRVHLQKLDVGTLSQVMRSAHGKVQPANRTQTVYHAVANSYTPSAAFTAAFRRATRARGPLARFMAPAARRTMNAMIAKSDGFKDMRHAYVEPDGTVGLSDKAIAALSPALMARVLDVPEVRAQQSLLERLRPLNSQATIAQIVGTPRTTWRTPAGMVDVVTSITTAITTQISKAERATSSFDVARAESLGAIWVGIANANVPAASPLANAKLADLGIRVPLSLSPRPAAGIGSGISGIAVTPRPTGVPVRPTVATPLGRPGTSPTVAPALSPLLRFETDLSRTLTSALSEVKTLSYAQAADQIADLVQTSSVMMLPPTPVRTAPVLDKAMLLEAVAPVRTATAYAKARISKMPSWLTGDWFDDGRVQPIMAAPRIDRPMVEALEDYDRDWLVPGLGTIAQTDFVTLLETNPQFTEAFLIGLSDEMGRELLWRGYPTDQRGTYFRRFWRDDVDELTPEIHRFSRSAVGSHLGSLASSNLLVLVVRGELIRRYPDAIMLAMQAGGRDLEGRPQFIDPSVPGAVAPVIFQIPLKPNILLVGFELTRQKVQTEDWWFLITEHPTAPRFGLDNINQGNPREPGSTIERDKLDWNDLTNVGGQLMLDKFLSPRGRTVSIHDARANPPSYTWPGSASAIARTLLQSPVRAAYDARKLLGPAS